MLSKINVQIQEFWFQTVKEKLNSYGSDKIPEHIFVFNDVEFKTSRKNITVLNEDHCREILFEHFDDAIINTYEISPYKKNLAIYCILYVFGGCYLDSSFFDLCDQIYMNEEIFQKNADGFFVCRPKHPIFIHGIQRILDGSAAEGGALGSLYEEYNAAGISYYLEHSIDLDISSDLQKRQQVTSSPLPKIERAQIPRDVYQTWHTKIADELPPHLNDCLRILREQNPDFRFHLYDTDDCREFIKKHFSPEVVVAFDTLKPISFKADLWRYCVLYICGGIYLDIKYVGLNFFRFSQYIDKEYFVADVNGVDVYTALIICRAGNPILMDCINQIVEHTKYKIYFNDIYLSGGYGLSVTGPVLLGEMYRANGGKMEDLVLKHFAIFEGKARIDYFTIKNTQTNDYLLGIYPTYRDELNKYKKIPNYGDLYIQRRAYNEW